MRDTGLQNNSALFERKEWVKMRELRLISEKRRRSMFCGSPMGGDFEGEWIHVFVWLSPFSVHVKLA